MYILNIILIFSTLTIIQTIRGQVSDNKIIKSTTKSDIIYTNNTSKISSKIDVKPIIFSEGGPYNIVEHHATVETISEKSEPLEKTVVNNTTKISSTKSKMLSTTTIKHTSTTTITPQHLTTVIIKPKKPLVTIGNDEPYAPSHFAPTKVKIPVVNETGNDLKPRVYMSKIDTNPDYVVPIIIFMFAIPLLVGLIMFGYRYGADWWDRRHYRRMDYLIEGIYNN